MTNRIIKLDRSNNRLSTTLDSLLVALYNLKGNGYFYRNNVKGKNVLLSNNSLFDMYECSFK